MLRIHQQARQCPGLVFELDLIARRAAWATLGFCRARTGTSLYQENIASRSLLETTQWHIEFFFVFVFVFYKYPKVSSGA